MHKSLKPKNKHWQIQLYLIGKIIQEQCSLQNVRQDRKFVLSGGQSKYFINFIFPLFCKSFTMCSPGIEDMCEYTFKQIHENAKKCYISQMHASYTCQHFENTFLHLTNYIFLIG